MLVASSMYSITVDRAHRIVRAEMSGFFSPDEVAAFARDEQVAAASLGCPSGTFGLLLVAQAAVLQSQGVVASFQRLLADLPLKAGRIAVVCEGALLTMQVRRIMTAERTAVFDQPDEALAWIADGLRVAAERVGTQSQQSIAPKSQNQPM